MYFVISKQLFRAIVTIIILNNYEFYLDKLHCKRVLFFKLTYLEKININCHHHITSLEFHENKKRNHPKTKVGTSGEKDLKFRPYWLKWNVRTMIILLLRLSFIWKMIKINILCMMFITILFLECPIGFRQILHKGALLPILWKIL